MLLPAEALATALAPGGDWHGWLREADVPLAHTLDAWSDAIVRRASQPEVEMARARLQHAFEAVVRRTRTRRQRERARAARKD